MMVTKNPILEGLLAGKRVALVGPSPHLVGSNIGHVIDNYDVVMRINEIIPKPDLRNSYGNRTDIMFHNCGTRWMKGLVEKIDDARGEWEKLKLVVCPSIKALGEQNGYLSWPDDHVSAVVSNFQKVNYSNIPFYWLGVKDYKSLWSLVGAEPNCGVLAVLITLLYEVKELFITGFSFYKQGKGELDVYYEGHWPKSLQKKSSFNLGHSQAKQIRIFKSLCHKDNRIKIDSYLNELLELNHPNVIQL